MPRQHTSNPKIPKVSKAIGSPFYAESGGQIGDKGYLTGDNLLIRVDASHADATKTRVRDVLYALY